ncbi:hypothetical protein LCGC14_2962260, partial [marine sediment metagenome]
GDVTVNVDLSELTTSVTNGDGDFFVVVDAANAQRKLTKANIALSGMNNNLGWTSNVGTVTSVTGGVGIDSSGGAAPSISLNLNELSLGGTPIAGDFFAYVDGTLSRKIAISSVNLGVFNNNLGWTSNVGTVTSVTGGTGIDSTGGATPNLTFDASELALGGTLVGTDHLVAVNGGVSNRQVISSIPLSIFNNDAGWTSNTGDITGVTAGNGLTGGGSSGSVTLNVVGTTNRISVAANSIDIHSGYVGQTSITTLGTIASGVWSGTTISSVTQAAVTAHVAAINHDLLLNFVAGEHFLQLAIVATGALDSGTISSGFGNINIGSSTFSTTGTVSAGSLTIESATNPQLLIIDTTNTVQTIVQSQNTNTRLGTL